MAHSWVSPRRDHLTAGTRPLRSKAKQFRHLEMLLPLRTPMLTRTEGDTKEGRNQARQDPAL